MLEPPAELSDDLVLDAVRSAWSAGPIDAVEHLAVGFGAHHWRASSTGRPRFFVTLDRLGSPHTAASLEAAYATASALAGAGLEFVHAGRPARSGSHTVALGGGLLSLAPWLDGPRVGGGEPADPDEADATAGMLRRLHDAPAPTGIPTWSPLVTPDLADGLTRRTSGPWTRGPLGERARALLRERLSLLTQWLDEYHRLAALARDRTWVPTHGEPHTRNQVRTPDGPVLVDWESVRLAPAERDLRVLCDAGFGHLVDADPAMLAMFDLEWRLDEVGQYAAWFEGPHADGPNDRTALGGLHEALSEPSGAR